MPRADDLPTISVDFSPVPSLSNALGIKGAPSTWQLAACASASRWVVGWDDESRSRPLCRLPVPRRDYQPRRLAVSMDGPRKARARFSDQTVNRLQLSIRPVMQHALLASMRSADRRPIILAGIAARYSQRVWP